MNVEVLAENVREDVERKVCAEGSRDRCMCILSPTDGPRPVALRR